MKNFIFLSAMAVASLSASAQAQQVTLKANPVDFTKGLKTLNAASAEALKAVAPKRSVEDGVLYGRPEGVYHSAYTFGGDGKIAALLVPGLSAVTYPNWCPNPGAATWSVEGSNGPVDLSANADLDNNLVMTWGINSYNDTEQYILTGYNQPTITVGSSSFTAPEVTAVANDVTPVMNCSPVASSIYGGFSDGPAFGTGSVLEQFLLSQDDVVEVSSTVEFYEKPAAPMYTIAFEVPFISYQEDPLGGKSLTMSLHTYGYADGVGYYLDEKKEELTCSVADVQGSFEDEDGQTCWYGSLIFYKETKNEFGDLVEDPFVIDYAYAANISGYAQEGVDVRFRLAVVDDAYQMEISHPTRFETVAADGSKVYYSVGNDTQFYKTLILTYCFFDGVVAANPEFASLEFSADGQTCLTDHPNVSGDDAISFIPFVSAAPFFQYDEAGSAVGVNYELEGLPEWLTASVSDEPRTDYGYSALLFECQPLPEGVEGRYADIYLVGRGAKNAKPFRVRQGTVAGINNISVENTGNEVLYNVAGQRVNNAKGIVLSKNGKKIVK